MAEKVRGIAIEISADASKFNSQMKGLSKDVKSTTQELTALQKGLEIEFDDAKFKRAQEVVQQAIDETANKADTLRARLEHLESIGAADTDEYKKWQTELAKTETEALKLQQQVEALNKVKLDNLTKQIDSVANGFTKAGNAAKVVSGAATAVIGGLAAAGLKAVSTADDIATLATQYDTTAKSIQHLNYVALQSDVKQENLYKSLVKVRGALSDIAGNTTSAASTALQKLNLDLNSFDTADELFLGIIGELSNMKDKTLMVGIANDLLGDKLANDILPLIYSGSEAIAEYSAEFEKLGALSDTQVIALSKFDNVLNRIKTAVKNVGLQIGASLLPLMEKIADVVETKLVPKLQSVADWFNNLTLAQQEFALKALLFIAALAPVLLGIGKLASGVSSIIKLIPTLNSALSKLAANPIIAIIGVIVGLLLLLYSTNEEFRQSINALIGTLVNSLSPILGTIINVFKQLINSIMPLINMLGGTFATVLNIVITLLTPILEMVAGLFELLMPLINIALIPLQLAFAQLSIPLQLLGALLDWLMPLFNLFAKLVKGVFEFIMKIINSVLGVIENAINWIINKINSVIDGINKIGGIFGAEIARLQNVSLKIDASVISPEDTDPKFPTDTTSDGGFAYDGIDTSGASGDIYNYDNSMDNRTQNITVVVENYAAEVDVDDMMRKINAKLAEVI